MKASRVFAVAGLTVALATAGLASAGSFSRDPALEGGGWTPRVPVSAFARPLVGLDPANLHVSTSFSVGSGFGGKAEGLQVTRLSYQFGAPLAMSVSLGNAFGSTAMRGGNSFFLEGMDLAYRPSANTLFSIHYKNLRSPLQYGDGWGGPFWAP